MTDFGEFDRLKAAIEAELDELKRAFKASVDRLKAQFPHDPDRFHAEMEALSSSSRDGVEAAVGRLHDALGIVAPNPSGPDKPRYEEPRRRPRGGSGRNLPKWPPRPSPRRPSAGGVTVEPDRPNNLSGGAAAPLEFD